MSNLTEKAKTFKQATALPKSPEEKKDWQKANYKWWQSHPMRYDWRKGITPQEFSKEFFLEIDKRFFSNSREYLPWSKIPFGKLIDFDGLKDKNVLEIGVGNGSHAQLLAWHAKSFTGIDITDYSVESTRKRFEIFGLKGIIDKMDAEKMDFPDNSFDFVWAWGVIHHSSNTQRVLEEIRRVLQPGGEAAIMVYYRGWWNYYVVGFLRSIFSGDLIRTRSLFRSIQGFTDGAIARYYSFSDWRLLVKPFFDVQRIAVFGPKTDWVVLPSSKLKDMIIKIIPGWFSRFVTSRLRMGGFLYSVLRKKI